jgi:hypothetical protein
MSEENRQEVSPEDGERLNRLSEEVRGRLTEMALIVGRVAGNDSFSKGELGKFVPREGVKVPGGSKESSDWMEILDYGPLHGSYGHIGGHWFVKVSLEVET